MFSLQQNCLFWLLFTWTIVEEIPAMTCSKYLSQPEWSIIFQDSFCPWGLLGKNLYQETIWSLGFLITYTTCENTIAVVWKFK